MRMLSFLALAACGSAPVDTDRGDTDRPDVVEPTFQFSFAVLADPHLTSNPEREARLEAAVAWVNGHAADRGIELVFVVGDIGWGGGLTEARTRLDALDVAYVPVLGDNEIQFGDEQVFDTVFSPVYDDLALQFPDFQRAPAPTYNPEHDQQSWFQNHAFTYRGLTLITLDWSSRHIGGWLGETGMLHDFDGGTFPWFVDALPDDALEESVLFFTHEPMHLSPGGFDGAQLAKVGAHTLPIADLVAANYAGHYHVDADEEVDEAGYDVFVTDAVWDDDVRVRLVEVWSDGTRFTYAQDLITVP